MGLLLENLKRYLAETSPEQLKADWEELEPLSHMGDDATEYLDQFNSACLEDVIVAEFDAPYCPNDPHCDAA